MNEALKTLSGTCKRTRVLWGCLITVYTGFSCLSIYILQQTLIFFNLIMTLVASSLNCLLTNTSNNCKLGECVRGGGVGWVVSGSCKGVQNLLGL